MSLHLFISLVLLSYIVYRDGGDCMQTYLQEPCGKSEEQDTTSKFQSDGRERTSALESRLLMILCRELSNEHEEYIIGQ